MATKLQHNKSNAILLKSHVQCQTETSHGFWNNTLREGGNVSLTLIRYMPCPWEFMLTISVWVIFRRWLPCQLTHCCSCDENDVITHNIIIMHNYVWSNGSNSKDFHVSSEDSVSVRVISHFGNINGLPTHLILQDQTTSFGAMSKAKYKKPILPILMT
jgi:hypothetical protein